MTKNKKTLCMLLLALFACSMQIFAEGSNGQMTEVRQQNSRVCKGVVLSENGEPIIGASVKVKGTKNGVVTDIEGNYTLNDVPAGSTIEISYIGCKPQEVRFTGASMRVTLKEDNENLDEVVVVAYGTQKKKDVTGSISAVDPTTLQVQNTSSVSRMLEGAAAGLQVASVDGQPGYDTGIRLRGVSSTNGEGAAALVVIDGVAQQPATVGNVNAENPLSQINPEDIASVTVLKDAASTALYGSRGANGVVLITTKSGRSGKAQISVETRIGANIKGPYQYPSISSAAEYYQDAWQSIYNSYRYGVNGTGKPGVDANGFPYTNVSNPNHTDEEARLFASQHLFNYVNSESNFQRNSLGNWMSYYVPGATYVNTGSGDKSSSTMMGSYLIDPSTGMINSSATQLWDESYEDTFFQTGFRQDYNLTARGGNEKAHYYMSFGYLSDPSYLKASKFERYTGRVNVDAQMYKWLKVGANVSYSHSDTQASAGRWGSRNIGNASGNTFCYIRTTPPIVSVYQHDADGNYVLDSNGDRQYMSGPTYSPLGENQQNIGNPFNRDLNFEIETNKDLMKTKIWVAHAFADFTLPYDFKLSLNFNLDENNRRKLRYMNSVAGRGAPRGGLSLNKYDRRIINAQEILSYNHDFDKHHVDAMAGHEYEDLHMETMRWGSADELIAGVISPGNFVSHYSNISGWQNPDWVLDNYRLESYLGRLNYNYAEKYYVSASLRSDGSSKFTAGNRWGTFWSVGAGWRISSEKFMEGTKDWLDNLKIRSSYGVTGNQNGVTSYYTNHTWSYGVAKWQTLSNGTGVPSLTKITSNGLVNDDITWEKVHQFDLGLDFSVLNSRITGTFEYYNNTTVNALYAQAVSPLANMGSTSRTRNAAKLRNRGFELELSSDIIRTKDFTWNVNVNGTHYRTTLVEVPSDQIPEWNQYTSDIPEGTWMAKNEAWTTSGGTTAHSGNNYFYLRGEGKDLFNLYMYKYAGVDQESGLPQYWHRVTYGDVDPRDAQGNAKINADGTPAYEHGGRYKGYKIGESVKTTVYSDASRYELGSCTPDWIGGITSTFKYKDFDLSFVIAYQLGGKIFSQEYSDQLYRSEYLAVNGDAIPHAKELVGNTWTPNNTGAYFPMQWWYNGSTGFYNGSIIGSWQYTDMCVFNASYLRVKNVTLGYTLPKKILNKIGTITGLRTYVSADNLFFISKKKGVDPSASLTGGFDVDVCAYPQMANVTWGVKIDF